MTCLDIDHNNCSVTQGDDRESIDFQDSFIYKVYEFGNADYDRDLVEENNKIKNHNTTNHHGDSFDFIFKTNYEIEKSNESLMSFPDGKFIAKKVVHYMNNGYRNHDSASEIFVNRVSTEMIK